MNRTVLTILAVDDDPEDLAVIKTAVAHLPVNLITCKDPNHALNCFYRQRPQMVLLDLKMAHIEAMLLIEQMVRVDPAIEVLLLTDQCPNGATKETFQKAVYRCLSGQLDVDKLRHCVQMALSTSKRRLGLAEPQHDETYKFEGLIGRSQRMRDMFAQIRRVAPYFQAALVSGPTGSGKELVARALHRFSPLRMKRLFVCDSSTINVLFDNKVMGSAGNYFSGAVQHKRDLFDPAESGTLLLDDIGDLTLAAQAELSCVLQNCDLQRNRAGNRRKTDLRIIAASHINLRAMVEKKKFRQDLYYRLSMVEINVPALTDRREDIPLLQEHFLRKFSAQYKRQIKGITQSAQMLLAHYPWPGNVRELENALASACMMADDQYIDTPDLPEQIRTALR